jgi:hypothetical protein
VGKSQDDGAFGLLPADMPVGGGRYGAGVLQSGVRHHETQRIREQMRTDSLGGSFE